MAVKRTLLLVVPALLLLGVGIFYLVEINQEMSDANLQSYVNAFDSFKNQYSKKYESEDEHDHRFRVFVDNFNYIQRHNEKESSYSLSVNKFADLTSMEFYNRYLQKNLANQMNSTKKFLMKPINLVQDYSKLPDHVDWQEKGAVNKVLDQGSCSSCWAFATAAVVEAAELIARGGQLQQYSQQQLVDCVYHESGCWGGLMDDAYLYLMKNAFIKEKDYPYENKYHGCKFLNKGGEPLLSGYVDVPANELDLKAAVSTQPVAIGLMSRVSSFQFYQKGILDDSKCSDDIDHAVVIVGYGEESGKKYWKIKNSWGKDWGEKGFIRIIRSESKSSRGICGITRYANYPVVK